MNDVRCKSIIQPTIQPVTKPFLQPPDTVKNIILFHKDMKIKGEFTETVKIVILEIDFIFYTIIIG
jgi:hypothetical protein